MAKLLDKLYNRIIEGKLKIESDDDVSGGTQLYKHTIVFDDGEATRTMYFITKTSTQITTLSTLSTLFNNGDIYSAICDYGIYGGCPIIRISNDQESGGISWVYVGEGLDVAGIYINVPITSDTVTTL